MGTLSKERAPVALLRGVPDSFPGALTAGEPPRPLDAGRARAQHTDYREALAASGYVVEVIPADEAHPDCPFVEDAAFVVAGTAIVTRPGAPSRRGETGPVRDALSRYMTTTSIVGPGTIDGGDVLAMGSVLFIGRTARTNDAAIAQVIDLVAGDGMSVVPVDVRGMLHLKSAVLRIDDETVLVSRGAVDEEAFAAYRVVPKDPAERSRCSVLPLADGRVMTTSSSPRTTDHLRRIGLDVVPVDVSQFLNADGGLTCLSILL